MSCFDARNISELRWVSAGTNTVSYERHATEPSWWISMFFLCWPKPIFTLHWGCSSLLMVKKEPQCCLETSGAKAKKKHTLAQGAQTRGRYWLRENLKLFWLFFSLWHLSLSLCYMIKKLQPNSYSRHYNHMLCLAARFCVWVKDCLCAAWLIQSCMCRIIYLNTLSNISVCYGWKPYVMSY